MEYTVFVVDKEPYCVWSNNLLKENLNFLNNIDPSVFERFANSQSKELATNPSPQSAILLRLSYGIALEALLSFLAATIQAPHCTFGWLNKCKPNDLERIVKKIKHEINILNLFNREYFNWKELSTLIHSRFVLPDKSKRDQIVVRFGELWNNFADDFLDPRAKQEFNSIKHGMRIHPGPVKVALGLQPAKDTPCPREKMELLCDSRYGSSFLELFRFKDSSFNFRVRRRTRVWNPINYFHGLILMKHSLNNILGYLRILNGSDPAAINYSYPEDETEFDLPWNSTQGLDGMDESESLNEHDIRTLTKDEILSKYKNASKTAVI
jgi:hypothetical protein